MRMKVPICVALGFILGLLTLSVWPGRSDTSRHWRAVQDYNTYVRDPSNYKPDTQTGLLATEPPYDPEPHLAALVAAGELNHLDIVLPGVPQSREVSKHWLAFCERHPEEIVYSTGNPSWVAFKPVGTQPTHLNIWFRDSGQGVVQQLVRELEEMGARPQPATN